jgi:hypothetical protein
MRITQSISLSNIQTYLFYQGGPPSGGGKPAGQFTFIWLGLFPDRRHHKDGGDRETENDSGGADRDRTDDPLLAKQVLSQLSYSPMVGTCGRDGGPG